LLHPARILLLAKDPRLRERAGFLLLAHFETLICTADPEIALELAKQGMVDAVISDFQLDTNFSGVDFRKRLATQNPHLPFVLFSAYANDPAILERLKVDRFPVLQKPPRPEDLIPGLQKLVPKHRAA
jgi:CheY-like chemotaxis protein